MKTASALILALVILTGVGLALSSNTPPTQTISASGSQVYTLPPELSSAFNNDPRVTDAELSTSIEPQSVILPVTQTSALQLKRVGQIGGVTYGVAVSGGRAYMGNGPRLFILDVSDPAHPRFLGRSGVLGAFVRDVVVRDGYAYVANGAAGLHIFNVTDPAHPLEVGFYDTPGWTVGVVVSGNYAYVADGDNGFLVFDIVNPAQPSLVGRYDTPGSARSVAVTGNYAFVVDYINDFNNSLQMINISDPTHPYLARSYQISGKFLDVAVAGNYVYTASWEYDPQDPLGDTWNALRVFYVVQDPLILAPIGEFKTLEAYESFVAVQSNYAYMLSLDRPLLIIDISDPTQPKQAGVYPTGGSNGLTVAGNYVYVAGVSSLSIVNISNPTTPTGVGVYNSPVGVVSDLAIVQGYVYLPGLRVVDVSRPSVATALGAFNLPFGPMAVMGDYAYVATDDRLRVWNVSNPITPTEVAALNTWADDVVAAGNYAYVAWAGGMNVLDISNPISPTQVGYLELPPYTSRHIAINGHYAYLAERAFYPELRIVDISNPISPTEISLLRLDYRQPLSSLDVQIVVTGNYVFLGDSFLMTMHMVDVSNPISPTTVVSRTYGGMGIAVAENYVYMADGGSGVRVIDITDPVTPTEVFVYNTPGYAQSVRVLGNPIYIADQEGGLVILRAYHHFSYLPLLLRN